MAAAADGAGIDRIGLDLEIRGKQERQKGRSTRIYGHKLSDAKSVFRRVTRGARFVRINPYHSGTRTEVEALIAEGAQVLMLPYFRDLVEVEEFSEIVAGRTVTVGLAETLPCLDFIGDSSGGVC